jgi:hypothetical protein
MVPPHDTRYLTMEITNGKGRDIPLKINAHYSSVA